MTLHDSDMIFAQDYYLPYNPQANNTSIIYYSNHMDLYSQFILPNLLQAYGSYVIYDKHEYLYGYCHYLHTEHGYTIYTDEFVNALDPVSLAYDLTTGGRFVYILREAWSLAQMLRAAAVVAPQQVWWAGIHADHRGPWRPVTIIAPPAALCEHVGVILDAIQTLGWRIAVCVQGGAAATDEWASEAAAQGLLARAGRMVDLGSPISWATLQRFAYGWTDAAEKRPEGVAIATPRRIVGAEPMAHHPREASAWAAATLDALRVCV